MTINFLPGCVTRGSIGGPALFVALHRSDLDAHAKDIAANGETYRIVQRALSADGYAFPVWVLTVTGRRKPRARAVTAVPAPDATFREPTCGHTWKEGRTCALRQGHAGAHCGNGWRWSVNLGELAGSIVEGL